MHADQLEIDESLVRRLLESQFPQWAGLPLSRVDSGGTENAVYRLGEELALRLPYRAAQAQQVDKDHRWLPTLAPQLPMPIPVPLGKGAATREYPCPWSVCPWIPGDEATLDGFADPCREARALADFVRALQAIDATGGPAPGQHNFYRGVPLAARDGHTREAISKLGGEIDTGAVRAAWEADSRVAAWEGPPVWIHGDLSPGNLLVRDGRLCGVIDWGGLGVGDPATELLPAWNLFRGESRDAFRAALGVDDATWLRGRGLALSIALVALPYYLDTNPTIVREARRGIEEILADHERLATRGSG